MKRRVRGIRKKLTQTYVILVCVMSCAFVVSSAIVFSSSVRQQTAFFLNHNAQLLAERMSDLVRTMESCSNAVMLSLNQVEVVGGIETVSQTAAGDADLARYNAITLHLFLVGQVYREVDALVFIDNAGRAYSTKAELEPGIAPRFLDRYRTLLTRAAGKSICVGIVPS
ncbi:MAG: hypothetical protein LBU58_00730, partial [Clostridiales bacterium]|nr:hypothetical protein [Clostridiales bacterium]